MKHKKVRIMRRLCLIVMLVCLFRIMQIYILSVRHEAEQNEVKDRLENAEEEPMKISDDVGEDNNKQRVDEMQSDSTNADQRVEDEEEMPYGSGIPGEEGGHLLLEKYKSLYMENGDVAGWLTVEGTKIDYPVMQCEDDEYYLHHDFDGKDSKYGCLYVRERADLENGTNFVIYGHNMRDGSMFGELDLYLEEEFYREHPCLSFDTLFEERSYEILAVFRSQVYSDDADVFKYYQFYEADTKEEFDDFYENIKELSLYDTGVTAEFGDTFLTLSTCAYHVDNGRLAVVAKRVKQQAHLQ